MFGSISIEHHKPFLSTCPGRWATLKYEPILSLVQEEESERVASQVGAQVMLLRNLELTGNDRMLVNGSRGVITRFITKAVSVHACHSVR